MNYNNIPSPCYVLEEKLLRSNLELIKSVKDLGTLVKEARKKQKLTQVELAQLSNVGTRFLSDLENGKPTCEIDKVIKVLANLGIKLEVNNG